MVKLVKIVHWEERTLVTQEIFSWKNDTKYYQNITILSAYLITGNFTAFSKLFYLNGTPKSQIVCDRYYFKDEPVLPRDEDPRNAKTDFNHYPDDDDSEEGRKEIQSAQAVQIPPHTQYIWISIAPGDWVSIEANQREEFILLDDNGNEIPLDRLLSS